MHAIELQPADPSGRRLDDRARSSLGGVRQKGHAAERGSGGGEGAHSDEMATMHAAYVTADALAVNLL